MGIQTVAVHSDVDANSVSNSSIEQQSRALLSSLLSYSSKWLMKPFVSDLLKLSSVT